MARTAYTLKITNPAGESRTIAVKPSLQVKLEERLGMPVWQRFIDGYTGAFDRLAFLVGQDDGLIPADMTFDDFIDSDDEWQVDIVSLGTPVVDAEGNA